jgi:hypothetical protein
MDGLAAQQRKGAPAIDPTASVAYLTREQHEILGPAIAQTWGFRVIGVVGRADAPEGRMWMYVRPGLERPLAKLPGCPVPAPMVLVFDVNGVLCAKVGIAGHRHHTAAHIRAPGGMGFILRPGASKLLRVCAAAGHEVWLWSTMQRATVDAVAAALAPWIPPGRRLCADDCTRGMLKDLRRVWDASGLGGPHQPPLPGRTILFDDDPAKAALQPQNVVVVPRFAPHDAYDMACVTDRGALGMLGEVARREAP